MSFKLPTSLENSLQEKYEDVHIKLLIENLFQSILEKTFEDGSCVIKGFGKFIAFKTYSKRIGSEVVRFKFRPAQALTKKIRKDIYLLENLSIQANIPFTEKNADKCKPTKIIKNANLEAISNASKLNIKKENEKSVEDFILNITNKMEKD